MATAAEPVGDGGPAGVKSKLSLAMLDPKQYAKVEHQLPWLPYDVPYRMGWERRMHASY